MFLDASAMIAILVMESDAAALARRLEQAIERVTSPLAIYEAVLGIARICNIPIPDSRSILDSFLTQAAIRVVPITAETGRLAVSAFERYGRGRHVASLNMGDCFSYAGARELDLPLLYKGNDFPQTDIVAA
jgi:ribonuclease VapC